MSGYGQTRIDQRQKARHEVWMQELCLSLSAWSSSIGQVPQKDLGNGSPTSLLTEWMVEPSSYLLGPSPQLRLNNTRSDAFIASS